MMSVSRSAPCCLLLGFCLVMACSPPPPPPKIVPALGARVELASGDVWLVGSSTRQRLITGAMLPANASLSLGEGARALVRLGNGTGIFLRGGTKIAISDQAVNIVEGELWADVPADDRELGRFTAEKVEVTAADAGFDVAVSKGQVQVYVARGLAVVSSPAGRAEVESGEQAIVRDDSVPEVGPVGFWEDWTGGLADRETLAGVGGRASGRIYGIDLGTPGAAPKELQISAQEVRTAIRDGVAHTTVDQRFFNPSSTQLEGWYWFTIPEGASVERFALEVNGALVDGEMVERGQAKAAYEEAIQRAFDPALLEWVDGRTYRARIFPIPPAGERRVVLSYTQLLPLIDGTYRYVYPMGGSKESRIQEFALQVQLGDEGKNLEIATIQDARVETDGTTVTMRRSGFLPRSDFLLELRPKTAVAPLRAYRFSTGRNEADYVMLRFAPDVNWQNQEKVPGDVVLVVDTSAGGGESERQMRAAVAEALLRALSSGDKFAVVSADLKPRIVYPEQGLAPADDDHVSAAMEKLAAISASGATDLGQMFKLALELVHGAEQPAVAYIGDGRPTVGELTAIELAERLRRSLGSSPARLFTVAVGAQANHPLLDRLARVGGGRSFRIDTPEQIVQEALRLAGTVKTPTMTHLEIDAGAGLDQVFASATGKLSEGEEVVLLARTHHKLPDTISVKGRLGGKDFSRTYPTKTKSGREQGFVPFLWARMYLERLLGEGQEENRGSIVSLGLTYALMTPFTSFLVLESDADYAAAGITRRERQVLWRGFDEDENTSGRLQGTGAAYRSGEELEQKEKTESAAFANTRRNAVDDGERLEGAPPPAEAIMMDERAMAPAPAPQPSRNMAKGRSSRAKAAQGSGMGSGAAGSRRPAKAAKDDIEGDPPPRVAMPLPQIATGPVEQPLFATGVCSDASRRPLSQRRFLWQQRLAATSTPAEWAALFFDAGSRCEMPRWEHAKAMLELVEPRARTPQEVTTLLAEFSRSPRFQKQLRRMIVRRTLDPDMVLGLYSYGGVNWTNLRRGLAALKTPKERLVEVRKLLDGQPDEPAGQVLLIEILLENDMADEARAVATRLRRDELAGPYVLATLCDLQAESGQEDEARRTCSELVEFDSSDPSARQRLGDLFLRHGWYEAAYRQYRTLTEQRPGDPNATLRLAVAACGMGRVDEGLRLERQISADDGEPGPADPRRWARLLSIVHLSRMILAGKAAGDDAQVRTLERNLRRIQTFEGPANLVLLVWEDLEASLSLVPTVGKLPLPVSEKVDAASIGLWMIDLGPAPPSGKTLGVELRTPPVRRAVPFTVLTVSWDGKAFAFQEQKQQLAPRQTHHSQALN